MRYILRYGLIISTLPITAIGFLWKCGYDAFQVGDDLACRFVSWVFKDEL